MSTVPVRLLPMLCPQCQTPVPARPEETAWVCATCGQGLRLDDTTGLKPLEFHYAAGIPANQAGRPFWIANATVRLGERKTYYANTDVVREAAAMWAAPRRFFIPAFTLPLEQALELGTRLLLQPPALNPGSPAAFEPVTVRPEDMRPLAEFIVLGLEAARKDKLMSVEFGLDLESPELWILPA